MSFKVPSPARIPILYVILGVLLVISIIPMYFYSAQVEAINGDRLKTNEMLLQNTVTRSLADDLSLHERSLRMMLANLSSAIQVASGGDIGEKNIEAPELRALATAYGMELAAIAQRHAVRRRDWSGPDWVRVKCRQSAQEGRRRWGATGGEAAAPG